MKFAADINNIGEEWVQVTISGIGAEDLTEVQIERALTSAFYTAALREENERLRKALSFYADTSKYPAPFTGGFGYLYFDCGVVARSALEQEERNND